MRILAGILIVGLSILSNVGHAENNSRDIFFTVLGNGINCVPDSPFIPSNKVMIIHSLGWQNGNGVATVTNIPLGMATVDDRNGTSKCSYPISVSGSPSFLISCRSVFPNSQLIMDFMISISKDLKSAEVRESSQVIGGEKDEPANLSLGTVYNCQKL
jgi:hypothetical protein